ncbi:hypothetical protein, partial [Escherichia coli]|uniref:hypothetical protein n=1 Tax=Escherichia coli TaxID=562 RepID=UPI0021CAD6E8
MGGAGEKKQRETVIRKGEHKQSPGGREKKKEKNDGVFDTQKKQFVKHGNTLHIKTNKPGGSVGNKTNKKKKS